MILLGPVPGPLHIGATVLRIEDYALIGDLQTAALVSRTGSIDWCCFPRFDSGACFAALLGDARHGRWLLAPAGTPVSTRRYRHDTLILESIYETDEGRIRAIDFMPPRGEAPDIVRIVEGLDGEVRMRSVLTWFPSHEKLPDAIDPEEALNDAEEFWLEWASRCVHGGEYHEEIHRSLLMLKELTYAPTGGIVAAPTTSLPEWIGGVRNWDYRYCWLRDTTLTLTAMIRAGYSEEAIAWRQWLLRAIAGDPADVQIMYGLAGERRLEERVLEWLPGYEESLPVRVGNAASEQLQLDVYGEVMDALYQARVYGAPADDNIWSLIRNMLVWLEENWRREDSGLWEVRGPNRHFTHSKVMAWVAFDRAVRSHEEFGREGPVDRWRELRAEIKTQILEQAWNPDIGAYVQYYGANELDASVLLMAMVGFLDSNDARFAATVDAIRR